MLVRELKRKEMAVEEEVGEVILLVLLQRDYSCLCSYCLYSKLWTYEVF